jgi:hypothetical protein
MFVFTPDIRCIPAKDAVWAVSAFLIGYRES